MKVLVNGCNGKMGQTVCNIIKKDEELELCGGFDKKIENVDFPFFFFI